MKEAELQGTSIPITSQTIYLSLGGRLPEAVAAARTSACMVMMEGAYEILGAGAWRQYMRTASMEEVQAVTAARSLLAGIAETYGAAGGRGLAQRIGRAMFRYSLKEMGERAGFREMGFRMLPSPKRVESGLNMLSCLFSEVIGAPVQVIDQESTWVLQLPYPLPEGEEGQMVCWLITGLLQEFTSWAGGGRFYSVTASECPSGKTQPLAFLVGKKPLD